MKKIIPHLWFNTEAKEAAEFYTSIFSNSKIESATILPDTPSGDAQVVVFELRGMPFMSISAGPLFTFNPSISFMVNFDSSKENNAVENMNNAWEKLSLDGKVLMPLQEYDFSKRYGWVEDKFGVSWQLILTDPEGEERPEIIPSLLFVNNMYGKAEEAGQFYTSVFKDSRRGMISRYPAGMEPDEEGKLMFSEFKLLDTWFVAMDSAREHNFSFNESISFIVHCDTQEEIDYYWEKLSAVPESEQCGWLKDKFGVSWQIVPTVMNEMMTTKDKDALKRMIDAFLPMKKFDIAALEKAFKGE